MVLSTTVALPLSAESILIELSLLSLWMSNRSCLLKLSRLRTLFLSKTDLAFHLISFLESKLVFRKADSMLAIMSRLLLDLGGKAKFPYSGRSSDYQ